MNLSASTKEVEQAVLDLIRRAENSVESLSETWTGSGIPGDIRITLSSSELAAQARAAMEEAIDYANERAEIAVRSALDYAVSSAVWGWRDGSRDIVDTGKLRDSLSFSRSNNGFDFSYSSPYAALVHYGGYVRPYGNPNIDAVYIPGRPWIDAVLFGGGPIDAIDLIAIYDAAITAAF